MFCVGIISKSCIKTKFFGMSCPFSSKLVNMTVWGGVICRFWANVTKACLRIRLNSDPIHIRAHYTRIYRRAWRPNP